MLVNASWKTPNLLLGLGLLLSSQFTLAEPATNVVGGNSVSGVNSQTVEKSTDANEITIKLKTRRPEFALAQNTSVIAPTTAVPEISAAEQAGLYRIYRSNLLKKTYQHVIYPESAIDRNQQGDVVLKLTITRDGDIQSVLYDKRADFSSLNKAAERAVKNAKPYPPAPKRLNGDSFEVIMPIKFRLAG